MLSQQRQRHIEDVLGDPLAEKAKGESKELPPPLPLSRGESGSSDVDHEQASVAKSPSIGFMPRFYLEYNLSRNFFDLATRTVKQTVLSPGSNTLYAGIVPVGAKKVPRFRIAHSNGPDFIEEITSIDVDVIGETAKLSIKDSQSPSLIHTYQIPLYSKVTNIQVSKKPAIFIDVKLCQRLFRASSLLALQEHELDFPPTDSWVDGLNCRISDLSDADRCDDRCIDYGAYKIITKFGGTHLYWGQRSDSIATWFHMRCDVCEETDKDGNSDFFVQAPQVTSDDAKLILLHDHVIESIQSVPNSVVEKAKKLWPNKIR